MMVEDTSSAVDPIVPSTEYEVVLVSIELEKATVSQLKSFCRDNNLRVTGCKPELKARVVEFIRVGEDSFKIRQCDSTPGGGVRDNAVWVVIEGEDLYDDRLTTAGFHGPTNRDSLPYLRPQKYFRSTTIERPKFRKLVEGNDSTTTSGDESSVISSSSKRKGRPKSRHFCRKRL